MSPNSIQPELGGHINIASVCMPCSLVPIYTLLPSPDENFPQLDIVEVYPFSGKGAEKGV